VVEESFDPDSHALKVYTIAVDVLERDASCYPSIDGARRGRTPPQPAARITRRMAIRSAHFRCPQESTPRDGDETSVRHDAYGRGETFSGHPFAVPAHRCPP
jgi:hypothetical protein